MSMRVHSLWVRSLVVISIVGILGLALRAQEGGAPPAPAATDLTLLHKLTGHEEAVYSIAFSSDGKLLATGSFDKTVRLWEAATGKLVKTFAGPNGHQNLVLSVAFSPDGKQLASCGSDNTIKLWDTPTSEPAQQFAGHGGAVVALALSPDGSRLATASQDKSVRIWDAVAGKLLQTCQGPALEVKGLGFTSDGQQLLGVDADQSLRVWNATDGQPLATAAAHSSSVESILVPPASNTALTAGQDGVIKVWQLPIGSSRLLNPPHQGALIGLALTGDGAHLISASADKTVRVSSLATATQERILAGPDAPVTTLTVGGAVAAAATADQRVLVWNIADGKALGQLAPSPAPITSLALDPQARELLLGSANGEMIVRSLPLDQERALAHPDVVLTFALTANGERLFTATSDRLVRGWNLASLQSDQQYVGLTTPATALYAGEKLTAGATDGELVYWLPGQGQPAARQGAHANAITAILPLPNSPDLVTAGLDGAVKRWRPPTTPKALANPANLTAAALSADGTRLLAGCADHQVRLWNLASGHSERGFTGPTKPIVGVSFSADGSRLAFVSADESLWVHQTDDGKELLKVEKLPGAPASLAIGPKGDLLAVGGTEGKVWMIQASDGKVVHELTGHAGAVAGVRFSPAGDKLITQGVDNTLQIWTVADGKGVLKIAHPAGLTAFTLSEDGRSILSGSSDQRLRFWNVSDGKAAGEMAVQGDVRAVAWRKDGLRILVGTADGRSLVYDRDGHLLEWGRQTGAVGLVGFGADGGAWLSAGADKNAVLFTPALVWSSWFAGGIRSALFLPGTQEIVAAGDDKSIKFIRPVDGVAARLYSGHQAPVHELALNQDGTKLASASTDMKVWLWNLADNRPEKVYAAPAAVTGLSFSGGGTSLAIASGPVVKRIDLATGKEEAPIAALAAPILRLILLEDAKAKQPLVLAATADKMVRLAGAGQPKPLAAHEGAVTCLAYHPTGAQVLSGGADKSVKLWDLAANKEVRSFAGPTDAITAVTFSREAAPTRVAAASADKHVYVWNLADGKEIIKLAHGAPVRGLAFSPDSAKLVTATEAGRVAVFDAASGQELQSFQQPSAINCVLFSADGRFVIFGGADKSVTLAPVAVLNVLATNPKTAINDLAVIPGGTLVAAACADGAVHLFNLAAGKLERTIKCPGPVQTLAVHKSGATLFTAGADKVIRVWNTADGKELRALEAPGPARRLAVSPSGAILLAACSDHAIALNIDHVPGQALPAEFGKALGTFAHAGPVSAVVFQANSTGFYSAGADKVVKTWRIAQDAPARNLVGHANIVDAVAYSPDRQALASAGHDGTARLWKVADGSPIATINVFAAPIYCLVFSADGKQLLAGSFARSAKLIDVEKKTVIREFADLADKAFPPGPYEGPFAGWLNRAFPAGHRDGVYAVAFAPDGQGVVTTGSDGQILVWNLDGSLARSIHDPALTTQGPRPELRAHRDWINHFRFTPDGAKLISVGQGGWLKVWNFADGRLLSQHNLKNGLYAVACSPDGQTLATANRDGTAFILKMP